MKKIKQIGIKLLHLIGPLALFKSSSPARGTKVNNDISYNYNKDETILTIINKKDKIDYHFVIGKEEPSHCLICHCKKYSICNVIKCSSNERIDKQDGYYLRND